MLNSEEREKSVAKLVAILGLGARGTRIADTLARAGMGRLRLIDRDYIEPENLTSHSLFDEQDIADGLPKAVAAAHKLQAANPKIDIEPVVADANPQTIRDLISGVTVVVDGSDNFPTRYLINDGCVEIKLPWVYGGTSGGQGMVMTINPYHTACLRCISPLPPQTAAFPQKGEQPQVDAAATIAGLQASETVKIIRGQSENSRVIHLDLEKNFFENLVAPRRPATCPACGRGRFDFLAAEEEGLIATQCGGDSQQLRPVPARNFSLTRLAQRLQFAGAVRFNDYMLWFEAEGHELTVFPDGRAIIKGSGDEQLARTLYEKYIRLWG